jgi:hypothetical protein
MPLAGVGDEENTGSSGGLLTVLRLADSGADPDARPASFVL